MLSNISVKIRVLLIGLGFYLFYVFGIFFPESLWGVHFIAFLPSALKWGFIGLSALCILIALIIPTNSPPSYPPVKEGDYPSYLKILQRFLFLLIAMLLGWIFYKAPIIKDLYGDAFYILKNVQLTMSIWDERITSELLYFNPFDTKIGTKTNFVLVALFSYLTGLSGVEVMPIMMAVSGGLFVFLWLHFVHALTPRNNWRFVLSIMGLTAPLLLMFFGHYEIYGLSMPLLLLYFGTLVRYYKEERGIFIGPLYLLFGLCLKFHFTAWLLAPSLLLTTFYHFGRQSVAIQTFFTWKRLGVWVLGLTYLVGLYVYFFVTESHFGTRDFDEDTLEQALFLPIIAQEGPPLDRYNLFSLAHIFDYFNMILMWSTIALFLLGTACAVVKDKIEWNEPITLVMGISLLIYIPTFFVFNPLLSMPTDWDIMSIPAPALLVFALIIVPQLPKAEIKPIVTGVTLALALLNIPYFMINTRADSLSLRYESLGKHAFKTYWKGTSTLIVEGSKLEEYKDVRKKRLDNIIEELEPYAVKGEDLEFSGILCERGILDFKEDKDYKKALTYFEKAFIYRQPLRKNIFYLVISHFHLKQMKEAHSYLEKLVAVQYPNKKKSLRMAVHVSLEAAEYEDALKYANQYLEVVPEDDVIKEVKRALENNDNVEKLKYIFERKG